MKPKPKPPRNDNSGTWTTAAAISVGIGGVFVFLSALFVFLYVWHLGSFLSDPYATLLLATLGSLLAAVALLGPIVLYIARRNGITDFWSSIEWNANPRIISCFVISGAALAVLYRLTLKIALGSAGSFLAYPSPINLGLYVAVVVMLGPAIEEVYFRGILFVGLERRLRTLPAIVVVTVVFALIHPGHQFYVLPVAIALGTARVKARSVAACVALHASYNLFLAMYQIVFPS